MVNLKIFCFLLISICGSVIAAPNDDAFQVVERWVKGITEADVDTVVGLYAPDAVFMGTLSKTIVTKPEGIKKYFQDGLLGNRRYAATLVESNVTAVSETIVMVTALDKAVLTEDGKTREVLGRLTFVLAKRQTGWKIVGFHRSAMPS
jgi:uncharacterized protein (TIGR02246 family)